MKASRRTILSGLAGMLLLATPTWAATPTAEELIQKMRAAGQARKRVNGGGRMVTVLQSPQDLRGIAWLLQDGPGETVQSLWEPYIRRVRKLIPVEGEQAFLGSEYTYGDLGMVNLHATYTLLGEEKLDGVKAYRIQEVPRSQWYYAQIVNWIAADTFFPLKREFYDPSNTLWKVETFGQVTKINGVPTVLRQSMVDKQTGGSTVIDTTDVRYGIEVPDSLFDPRQLPHAVDWSWK
jgi:hypothetical protein